MDMSPEGERPFNPPKIVETGGEWPGGKSPEKQEKSIAGGSAGASLSKKAREKTERENLRLWAMVELRKEEKGLIESFVQDISSTGKVSPESAESMNRLRRKRTEFYEKDGKEPKEADRLAQGDIASAYLEAEEKAKKIKSEAEQPKPEPAPGSQGEKRPAASEGAGMRGSEKTEVREARVQEKKERDVAEKTALDEFQAANQPLWNELFNAYRRNYSVSRAGGKISSDAVKEARRLENQVRNYFIRESGKPVRDADQFTSAVLEHLKGLVRDAYASERKKEREALRNARAERKLAAGPRDAYSDEEYKELVKMQAAGANKEAAVPAAAEPLEEKMSAVEAPPAAETPPSPEEQEKIERLRKAVVHFREHLPSMFPREGAGYALLEEKYAEQLKLQTTAYARGAYRKLGLPPEGESEVIQEILSSK